MNIEEEGGSIMSGLKGVGSRIKGSIGKTKEKVKQKAQDMMIARAKAQALKAAEKSAMGALGNATKDLTKTGKYGSISSKQPTQIPILKLLIIIGITGVLGAFAALAINKSQNFNDSILKWGILMLVLILPVFIAYMKKSETLGLLLDTIVESELNIICIYAILAFTSYSTLVKSPSLDTFNSMKLEDKIGIIVALLIPLGIIVYSFVKVSPLDGIVIGLVAVSAAAILLSPTWI